MPVFYLLTQGVWFDTSHKIERTGTSTLSPFYRNAVDKAKSKHYIATYNVRQAPEPTTNQDTEANSIQFVIPIPPCLDQCETAWYLCNLKSHPNPVPEFRRIKLNHTCTRSQFLCLLTEAHVQNCSRVCRGVNSHSLHPTILEFVPRIRRKTPQFRQYQILWYMEVTPGGSG